MLAVQVLDKRQPVGLQRTCSGNSRGECSLVCISFLTRDFLHGSLLEPPDTVDKANGCFEQSLSHCLVGYYASDRII